MRDDHRNLRAGERVMVVARRDFDPQTFDPRGELLDLLSQVRDLTLLAMVGIVDPPCARPWARRGSRRRPAG